MDLLEIITNIKEPSRGIEPDQLSLLPHVQMSREIIGGFQNDFSSAVNSHLNFFYSELPHYQIPTSKTRKVAMYSASVKSTALKSSTLMVLYGAFVIFDSFSFFMSRMSKYSKKLKGQINMHQQTSVFFPDLFLSG